MEARRAAREGDELCDLTHDSFEMDNPWPNVVMRPSFEMAVKELQARLLDWCLETEVDLPHRKSVGA